MFTLKTITKSIHSTLNTIIEMELETTKREGFKGMNLNDNPNDLHPFKWNGIVFNHWIVKKLLN